ncbi:MAG: hypothetical protein ACREXR_07095, partial [Gammaproteobacteria bacterium]
VQQILFDRCRSQNAVVQLNMVGVQAVRSTIGISLDALVVIVILFLLSFGGNFYQRLQYADLLEGHKDLNLSRQLVESHLTQAQRLLAECNKWAAGEASKNRRNNKKRSLSKN